MISPDERLYNGDVDNGSYRIWIEACPPYCDGDDTGISKLDGIDSCSGPNPIHYVMLFVFVCSVVCMMYTRSMM